MVNFNPMDSGYTHERALPVCDKPYHTNKFFCKNGRILKLRNCALRNDMLFTKEKLPQSIEHNNQMHTKRLILF